MIPETTAIKPRPVWARYQRRLHGKDLVESNGLLLTGGRVNDMLPPTDAEKHDAILVLRDGTDWPGYPAELYVEAQRIMDECS